MELPLPFPGLKPIPPSSRRWPTVEENPVSSIKFAKLYEVQKYLTLDGHTYGVDFMLINDKFYQSLPKDIQRTLKTASIATATIMRGIQTIDSTLGIQFLKEKGMEVYVPTEKEKAMFRDASQKPGKGHGIS